MKVKSDHQNKLSNLSNWKEVAWKISGLQGDLNLWPTWYWCDARPTELWSHTLGARSICFLTAWEDMNSTNWPRSQFVASRTAQLVAHCTGIAEVTGSNPIEALMFFRLNLPSELLKLENLLLWSLSTFIYNCSTTWISYIFHNKNNVIWQTVKMLKIMLKIFNN